MHDRPQMPPPPEGCVYGPWWDDKSKVWLCIVDDYPGYWDVRYLHWDFEDVLESPMSRELLRLATELAQREARINELEGMVSQFMGCTFPVSEKIHPRGHQWHERFTWMRRLLMPESCSREARMPDCLTLKEAKAEIRGIASSTNRHVSSNYNWAFIQGLLKACDILNRVKPEPDEEGQAVLWLMREKGWVVLRNRSNHRWIKEVDFEPDEWEPFIPIEEAKKLGWGGGE